MGQFDLRNAVGVVITEQKTVVRVDEIIVTQHHLTFVRCRSSVRSMNKQGRPKVPKVPITCANPECKSGEEGKPGVAWRYPSQVEHLKTGRAFCDNCLANPVGLKFKPKKERIGKCSYCGSEFVQDSPFLKKFCPAPKDCNAKSRENKVEFTCKVCGRGFLDAASRDRKVCDREECNELWRYKRALDPPRVVNGKLARWHQDRKHVLIWNGEDWELEGRWLGRQHFCECRHLDLWHGDGKCEPPDLTDEEDAKQAGCTCPGFTLISKMTEHDHVHHHRTHSADTDVSRLRLWTNVEHSLYHNGQVKDQLDRFARQSAELAEYRSRFGSLDA